MSSEYPTMFSPDSVFVDAVTNIMPEIRSRLKGRLTGLDSDYGLLAQAIFDAGDGDYIEFGSLYGASAVLASLIKNKYNIAGIVMCVDPLDGYYGREQDPVTPDVPVDQATFWHNVDTFDVKDRIRLSMVKSSDFRNIYDNIYSIGFVDGNHWGTAPLKDIRWMQKNVTSHIVVDNYDYCHQDVVNAVYGSVDSIWTLTHVSGLTAILQKDVEFKLRKAFAKKMAEEAV